MRVYGFDGMGEGYDEDLQRFFDIEELIAKANAILETFDFRDIEKATAWAKTQVPYVKTVSQDEGIQVVKNLFNYTIHYLKNNCIPLDEQILRKEYYGT